MIHFVTVAVTVFLQPPHAVVSEIQVKLSQSHRAPNNFLGLSKCTVQFSRTRRRNPYSFTWLYDTYQQTSLSHRRVHTVCFLLTKMCSMFFTTGSVPLKAPVSTRGSWMISHSKPSSWDTPVHIKPLNECCKYSIRKSIGQVIRLSTCFAGMCLDLPPVLIRPLQLCKMYDLERCNLIQV